MDGWLEWKWLELGTEGEEERDEEEMLLSRSASFSSLFSLTVVFNLNASPKSSVQTAISGHPVAMATLATLGHKAAGAHSGMSFFPVPPLHPSVSSVSVMGCSLSHVLIFLWKHRGDRFTLFLHTYIPMRPCISIPLFLTLLSPFCVVLCLSLCLCGNYPARMGKVPALM